MSPWTLQSIELATSHDYLDQLFRVYPVSQELVRELKPERWLEIEQAFNNRDNALLLRSLLKLDRFPVKDSYVSFLREYNKAVELNPNTVNRIVGSLHEMGLEQLKESCLQPKESNTRIGPLFSRWLYNDVLGCETTTNVDYFRASSTNILLKGTDKTHDEFAKKFLGYSGRKGIDLIAKFNGKYVIGEAKFITAEGGNQRNQIATTRQMLDDNKIKAIKIAIFDGVIYLPSNRRLLELVCDEYTPHHVLSALYLRDFLYSL